MKHDPHDIREQFRRHIERLGITQAKAAERMGITQANLSDYLNRKSDVRTDTLAKMADALGLAVYLDGK